MSFNTTIVQAAGAAETTFERLWRAFNFIFPVGSEYSSFFLDSRLVKATKLNNIAGFILAIVTLSTPSDTTRLNIASAALAIIATIVSFRLNRVKRNTLKNEGLGGINTRIFLFALLFHITGWILSLYSFIQTKSVVEILAWIYHAFAVVLASLIYCYQSAVFCCCRDKDALRSTFINRLEKQTDSFTKRSNSSVTIVTEINLVHVLNQLDKVDKEDLSAKDQDTINKVKERVVSVDLSSGVSNSVKERFERLRTDSVSSVTIV